MATRELPLRHYRFPEPAGQMQDEGRVGDLVRELGDNYDRYHEALAEEFEARGSDPPDPAAYRGRYEDYCRDGAYALELVIAESMLRDYAKARGAASVADGTPLVDERHRLFSARPTDERRTGRRGSSRAVAWSPPPPPPNMPL